MATTSQYFQDRKKGQMNELKNLLNGIINDNDIKKGREVVHKVIAYMTQGIDVSPIFSEMCRASFINDEVMKKMIYFYLTTYAEDNPDLAIMAVNTFKKDCRHSIPKIRGLALRNLCSFKSSDYVNTVLPIIRELLNDFEPYVKKTAIMGVLKVFYVEPAIIIEDQGLISALASLIRDSDGLVSTNALLALDEILISEGGVHFSSKLYFYLLNRLREYNEWEQASILELLYRYMPQSEKEHYDILTVLWQKLKQSSTPLVLGSIRIILKLAREKQQLFNNVVEKTKAPLLTLMSGNESKGCFEISFVVLQHIQYVIENMGGKRCYELDFKYFYCRVDEPTYIKAIKIRILGLLANEFNLGDLLNELNEYANDNDHQMARSSVEVLVDIALRLAEVSKALLINITSFYKSEEPHLVNEAMIGFYRVLRKYPSLFADIKPSLVVRRHLINEQDSQRAFLWLLGTFAQHLEDSPYILEQYLQEDVFTALSSCLKQILLTQTVQTFLKRPLQMQGIITKIFKQVFQSDNSSMCLLDHAAFYYRALQDNVEEVKRAFVAMEVEMSKYRDNLSNELSFEEDFNTLSMIYRQKEYKFIKNYEYFITMRSKELGIVETNLPELEENGFELGNISDGLMTSSNQYTREQELQSSQLEGEFQMTQNEFEQVWQSLEQYSEATLQIRNEEYLDEQGIEQLFKLWNIQTMATASQDEGTVLQFFMYASIAPDIMCLSLHINKIEKMLHVVSKAASEVLAELLNKYIRNFLTLNEFM